MSRTSSRSRAPIGFAKGILGGLAVVLVVLATWLGFTLSQSVTPPSWVRVWGTTQEAGPRVLRLERSSLEPTSRRRDELFVAELRDESGRVERRAERFDEDAVALVSFSFASAGASHLRVTSGEAVLAEGPLRIAPIKNQLKLYPARISGRRQGPIQFEVEVVEGRLQFGRAATLEIKGAPNGRLIVEAQGLEPIAPKVLGELTLDERGQLSLRVRPQDLSVSLRLANEEPASSSLTSEIPVEKIAYWAENRGRVPTIVAPTSPANTLNYALISERGLWARGKVKLASSGAIALTSLKLPEEPSWLIVGQDPALDGASAIGWPMSPERRDTATWREGLLLDGKPLAMRAYERAVSQRAKKIVGAVAATGFLFLLTVAYYWRLMTRPPPVYEDETGRRVAMVVDSSRWIVGLVLLLAVGFAALGLWATVRLGGG